MNTTTTATGANRCRWIDNRRTYWTPSGALAHDATDTTPAVLPAGYDPRCSLCWLGYGHTTAVHTDRVGR